MSWLRFVSAMIVNGLVIYLVSVALNLVNSS
jgi:hypothetical protein